MIDLSIQTAKLQSELTAAYAKLSVLEQKIVQLFAIIYEPVNRATFLDCFNKIVKGKNGNSLTQAEIKPHLDKLIKLDLLIQERGYGPRCNLFFIDLAIRDAIALGHFERMVKAVEEKIPIASYGGVNSPRNFRSEAELIREVRIGIYRQDMAFIHKQFTDYYRYSKKEEISLSDVLYQVYNNPFDRNWFSTLSQEFYELGLASILDKSFFHLLPASDAFNLLQEKINQTYTCSNSSIVLFVEQNILRGKFLEAKQVLESLPSDLESRRDEWGWLYFLHGERETAIAQYREALTISRKSTGKRQGYFNTISGLFFILALIQEGTSDSLKEAEEYAGIIARQTGHWLKTTYTRLQRILKLQMGDLAQKEALVDEYISDEHSAIETFFCALCLYWTDPDKAKKRLPKILEPLYDRAVNSEYLWLAMEVAELLSKLGTRNGYKQKAAELRQGKDILAIADLIHPQETWELSLNALLNLNKSPAEQPSTQPLMRLVWFIKFFTSGSCSFQPREQKINVKGVWSQGRNIALKRLKFDRDEFDYLTPQDLRVCASIVVETTSGYYGQTYYDFDQSAICALIGHPLVFWEDSPTTRVEIVKGEPEILVKERKGDRLSLEFFPKAITNKNFVTIKESPTKLKVFQINADHRRILEILGKDQQLEIPVIAKERVLAAINAISSIVTVHSDIGGGIGNAEEVPTDSKPHIHLLPAGEGLKVALLTRPFAQGGAYYRPGAGGATVIAEIDGKRLQTTRDLKEEKKLAQAIVADCPTFASYPEQDGEWSIEDPENCLELLLELQELGDRVVLEWPEGEKLKIGHRADMNSFRMSIQRQKDWFAMEGELKLGDDLVLDMQRLLELLDKTPSRFVPLGNGQFLALTQEFRQRLDELRRVSEKNGKGMKFHPLAGLALEEFVDEVGSLKTDKHWKEHVKRLKAMQSFEPQLPSTLQAELRDYQIDGFRWLARLAFWGVGACLADDMGLGKTLQALALILTRAPEGATLIVAPTSVCMNWISEALKFAPTLNVIPFGTGNRQQILDDLQAFDIVICSYGLLQQEEVAEMLAQVQWQTIVLDEAQAIKNFATKRSQAAMTLQGGFKLITTGTPIENHIGELWNLFRFINPGLLGSLESFNQRFANPIERSQDKQARSQLKKLIQPFLLRRTKNQVLAELPQRTEITLQVELSKEEMAFYEALRRDAIAKLSHSEANAGQKHLQVLAEIMKLRRACCNTRLVKSDIPLPSAKLQLFGETLSELLENKHKALVFSQFVDHLQILREYLDLQKIHYQYLDGSTPANERKKRVDAFQSGEGDVFLISLKAGGTGLNLTAADYVIHMDPWWNPAVEDQASDRAHRIGQLRPVTIYRLVAKDTIEEKILELHAQKRDLADSLLEGTDMSGKISTEALLQLIRG
ncbi:DEAD/DEAH box helicase [Tumidithrix elongata RA019]|uniref:DEAD/DEAH box helicase n=1 Tax=Tumidithrix elongata BACA0141 TaxID=2716417 RepID=A0AAW9Q8A5_9CYAN|nr:DEAD/DEAH box helicase [Tumidithrix elongata RA019]